MKLFQKWLRQESEVAIQAQKIRSIGSTSSSARNKDDEYLQDSSFSWLGVDQNFGDVPDSLLGTDEEKSSTDTATVRTLSVVEESPVLDDEEHAGFDPYNTCRFEVVK